METVKRNKEGILDFLVQLQKLSFIWLTGL